MLGTRMMYWRFWPATVKERVPLEMVAARPQPGERTVPAELLAVVVVVPGAREVVVVVTGFPVPPQLPVLGKHCE